MVVYQLVCVECGAQRIGRNTDGDILPVRDECPECGEAEYEIPALDSG